MMKLTGRDGFELWVNPAHIDQVGVERHVDTLFVVVSGREYRLTGDVDRQYAEILKALNGDTRRAGIR